MSGDAPLLGSFRDPKGHIYLKNNRVFRTIRTPGMADFRAVEDTGLLSDLVERGWLLPYEDVAIGDLPFKAEDGTERVLEHPKLPFVSYPYEWCFSELQDAALLHLDIQIAALDAGVTLSDATAYNVQFVGGKPVFIDHLSFQPYREGEMWLGHKQFTDQFLNPLLLTAKTGVSFNNWFRGGLEGIPATDLSPLLPLRSKFGLKMFTQVVLQARLEKKNRHNLSADAADRIRNTKFPKAAYRGMLTSLRGWIAGLKPKGLLTEWGDYTTTTSYTDDEAAKKDAFVRGFSETVKPSMLLEIGCNRGDYAKAALEAGAKHVIGIDGDPAAIEDSYRLSKAENLAFTPILMNFGNPSPSQGWAEGERDGLAARAPADGMQALALIHHLAIGGNVPLERCVDWLMSLAKQGVIEFVPKTDPMAKMLLQLRDDIFADYTLETFITAIERRGRIVKQETVTKSGRVLVWFERA